MNQKMNLVGLKGIQNGGGELVGRDQSRSHLQYIISQNILFKLKIFYSSSLSVSLSHIHKHTEFWVMM